MICFSLAFDLHYPKSLNLYGLWENRCEIEKKRYITLFEAEKSVLKRDSRLDPTGSGLSGHTISNEQVSIILGLDIDEVVIAMDNDVDINVVRSLCEKFYLKKKVSYIYDTFGILGEKDSPADVCEEDYNKLFNSRIVYDEVERQKYIDYIMG